MPHAVVLVCRLLWARLVDAEHRLRMTYVLVECRQRCSQPDVCNHFVDCDVHVHTCYWVSCLLNCRSARGRYGPWGTVRVPVTFTFTNSMKLWCSSLTSEFTSLCRLQQIHLLIEQIELSVLWCCWLGSKKGIRPVKTWVVRCWHGYLSGSRCK